MSRVTTYPYKARGSECGLVITNMVKFIYLFRAEKFSNLLLNFCRVQIHMTINKTDYSKKCCLGYLLGKETVSI